MDVAVIRRTFHYLGVLPNGKEGGGTCGGNSVETGRLGVELNAVRARERWGVAREGLSCLQTKTVQWWGLEWVRAVLSSKKEELRGVRAGCGSLSWSARRKTLQSRESDLNSSLAVYKGRHYKLGYWMWEAVLLSTKTDLTIVGVGLGELSYCLRRKALQW